jgi:hypothetical protein
MMRLLLALAAMVGLWFIAGDTTAQPQPAPGGKAHQLIGWPRTVEGIAADEQKAQDNALEKAVKRINECLKAQDAPLSGWQVDKEYVRKHVLAGPGQAGPDIVLQVGPPQKVWIQPLHEADMADLLERSQVAQRHSLASERQTLAAYSLAVLSALLLIAWGYLRLDEWTGGRISSWLRIGAIGLAVVAIVAWCWPLLRSFGF